MIHTYYRTCPECGAHLDPDETCDCEYEKEDNPNDGNQTDH